MFNFRRKNASIKFPGKSERISMRRKVLMSRIAFVLSFLLMLTAVFHGVSSAQTFVEIQSQEVSEIDGVPVIIKHLPDWENKRGSAVLMKNSGELRKNLGEQPVFNVIDFEGGTEAVTAPYDAGKLLIVEYNTPQGSIDADNKIKESFAGNAPNPPVYYRRVGNYNVFVFDATDEDAANALIDQVKYEKVVQWLGEDPFLYERAQKRDLTLTYEIFLATVGAIMLGIGVSVLAGIGVGALVFFLRRKQRAGIESFSDAGGMLRLNLDDLTPEVSPDRLLKD